MPDQLTLFPDDPDAAGPYRLEGRLGTGGQGVVYAGRGPGGALVAVKLLHPHLIADDEARTRFLREVRTAKRVAPFCTAQMLDSGFVGARPYIVSEFVDGPSLQESVKESGPRGAAALQRLAINTATALAAIHAAGVVHRDFKPGNVLLGPRVRRAP
ncbi:protein kinase domain-containing protein [Nonomuraea sp. LPB2021202275-12-8]|uniref:protein kinase domain-containing protein n=1 Tax=Nonomuraea sp. LPB2021202275-12-8 TaxID=3120159 RepID=UPI00300C94CD